jgi:hypothetical protein
MHIYANEGVKVQIHHGLSEEEEKE